MWHNTGPFLNQSTSTAQSGDDVNVSTTIDDITFVENAFFFCRSPAPKTFVPTLCQRTVCSILSYQFSRHKPDGCIKSPVDQRACVRRTYLIISFVWEHVSQSNGGRSGSEPWWDDDVDVFSCPSCLSNHFPAALPLTSILQFCESRCTDKQQHKKLSTGSRTS